MQAHVGSRLADAVAPVAARAQRALLGVAALLQSLVRCLQLAAAALQLRVQQQQLAYAGPAMGEEGNQGGETGELYHTRTALACSNFLSLCSAP